ncbi:MAG: four-carbon acid sugar kinase family protein [Saccharofermentanales bacterium]
MSDPNWKRFLHASGVNRLLFIPAYPKNNRITIGGVHWINGAKVAESIFAHDPFEPVRHSNVADIIF